MYRIKNFSTAFERYIDVYTTYIYICIHTHIYIDTYVSRFFALIKIKAGQRELESLFQSITGNPERLI